MFRHVQCSSFLPGDADGKADCSGMATSFKNCMPPSDHGMPLAESNRRSP